MTKEHNSQVRGCVWYSKEDEPLPVSSVGVLAHCYDELRYQGRPWFLMIQKADITMETISQGVVNPWSIPAGKPNFGENDPKISAVRELREETGVDVDPNRLDIFPEVPHNQDRDDIRLVYALHLTTGEILGMGEWETFIPGDMKILKNFEVEDTEEVKNIALVSSNIIFGSTGPITYKWEVIHHVKARLENLRIL